MALVLYDEPKNHIGKITFNDPDSLNAMGEKMAAEFSDTVKRIAKDGKSLRVIILTGAGRAFSAGGDLEMLEGKTKLSGEENRVKMLAFYSSFLDILKLNIPLIAAINGHAVGAGLCVACACDIRIAHEKAKLGFTFTKLGLHPGMGATYFLPQILGRAVATELMVTGRMIDATEALRIGLVSRVVGGDVMNDATSIAEEILECGPQTTRQLLETLRKGSTSLEAALENEARCQSVNYASAEFKEGVTAVKEKRKARF